MKKRLGFSLILLGMITSGKETQAKILMDKYALMPVESGKYWRKRANAKTPEGELLRRTFSIGLPAPVKLMKQFLISYISKKPKNKNLLFVGNPRLKPEAQLLKKLMDAKGEKFYGVYLTLPDKLVYQRSQKRVDGNMKEMYKILDDKKIIRKRIKYHKEQVSKSVEYLAKLGKMKIISGNQPIAKVAKDIEKTIQNYQKKSSRK